MYAKYLVPNFPSWQVHLLLRGSLSLDTGDLILDGAWSEIMKLGDSFIQLVVHMCISLVGLFLLGYCTLLDASELVRHDENPNKQ